jgi:hypothetical protein
MTRLDFSTAAKPAREPITSSSIGFPRGIAFRKATIRLWSDGSCCVVARSQGLHSSYVPRAPRSSDGLLADSKSMESHVGIQKWKTAVPVLVIVRCEGFRDSESPLSEPR